MVPGNLDRDTPRDGYSFQYSCTEEGQPVRAIVKAVAWAKGVDVQDLDPLYSTIDVKLLKDFFENEGHDFYRNSSQTDPADLEIRFQYMDCSVSVTTDQVRVECSETTDARPD